MPDVRTALVVNVYDIGNWGDTAIAEGLIALLRDVGYERVVIAPMDWPDRPAGRTAAEPDAIVPPLVSLRDGPRVAHRVKPLMLGWVLARIGRAAIGGLGDPAFQAYRDADLVVSVGGGFLGGSKAGANLIKVANVRAGLWAGRRTLVGPVSVNPYSPNVGRVLRWGLRGVPAYGRDAASTRRMVRLHLDGRLAPDLALRAPSLRAARAAATAESPRSGVIGWAPRSYRREHRAWGDPQGAEDATFEGIRRVIGAGRTRVRLIPHVRAAADDDQDAVDRVYRRFSSAERARIDVDPGADTLGAAVGRYASLDALVTSRMHAALFALAVGTPSLAVGYEPKVADIFAGLGLADRVVRPSGDQSPEELERCLDALSTTAERARTLASYDAATAGFAELASALAGSAAP
jgi:polysaccharide pyruvyl transferase WcaK-like protein